MNYILFGEEEYLIEKRTEELLRQILGDEYKMSAVEYNAMDTSIQTILDDASMIPFFSDKKGIVVRQPFFLSASLSSNIEFDDEALLAYCSVPNEWCDLIFVCPYPLDERRKIVKQLRKVCKVEEFKKLDGFEIARHVRSELKQHQVAIKEKDIDYLCACMNGDLMSIANELEKIKLYDGVIDRTVIDALVSRPLEDNVFELVNAVIGKDMRRSFAIWHDFMILNKEPLQLIGALAAQFRFCYQVSYLGSTGLRDDEISQELGCKTYRVTKTKQLMKRGTPQQFLHILSELSALDQNIKNGLIDKKNGFELFLIKVSLEGTYGVHYATV